MKTESRTRLGISKKAAICFTLVTTLASSLTAQEWQLGHQPQQYSVPQYTPANEASIYPLPQEEIPAIPAPRPTLEKPELVQPAPTTDVGTLSAPPAEALTNQLDAKPDISGKVVPIQQDLNSPKPEPAKPVNQAPESKVSGPNSPDPKKNQVAKRFGLDYSIYRDYNTYPVDPRKPCNQCTHPTAQPDLCGCQWPGKNGQPYREREPGGCECSKASKKHHGNFSINWPGPFSAIRESHSDKNHCGAQCSDPNRKRINDRFDHLASWKLIDYKRSDNGYSGASADRYGCLGESRVAGLQLRQPGESVNNSIGASSIR